MGLTFEYSYKEGVVDGWYEPKKRRYIFHNYDNNKTVSKRKDLFEQLVAKNCMKQCEDPLSVHIELVLDEIIENMKLLWD